jgi:hypothetical protein
MIAPFLLTTLVATTASAAGLLGAAQPGTLRMAPRGGFNLPNGDINGPALVQALTDTLMRYSSAPFSKPYIPTAEERAEAAGTSKSSLLDPAFNGSINRRAYYEALSSDQDVAYDGYITIGTRMPTRFLMQFDTGK